MRIMESPPPMIVKFAPQNCPCLTPSRLTTFIYSGKKCSTDTLCGHFSSKVGEWAETRGLRFCKTAFQNWAGVCEPRIPPHSGFLSSASIFPIRVCVRERQRERLKGVADADKSHAGKLTEPSLYRTSEVRLYISQDLDFIRYLWCLCVCVAWQGHVKTVVSSAPQWRAKTIERRSQRRNSDPSHHTSASFSVYHMLCVVFMHVFWGKCYSLFFHRLILVL